MAGDRLRALAAANPEAATQLLLELKQKTVIPHTGGQQEIMADKSRFQVVCCGRRFGKTTIAAKKALLTCREKKTMVWWVAPTYKVVKRGYNEVLKQLPAGVLTKIPQPDSNFDAGRAVILKFKNGSRMEFYSAERPEGMLGAAVDFVVLDEAATMNPAVWESTIRPTLMDRSGNGLLISTPRGRNWFYYVWLRGQDKDEPEYSSWRFPTGSNPYIKPEEVREMERTLPLLVYQQEVLAEFVASAGAVFRFNPDIIQDRVQAKGHIFVGVDLAKSNDFTVFSAARMDDCQPCGYDRFVDVAWKLQRERLKNFVKRLYKEGATHVTLVIDSTGVGDPIAEEMESEGYDVIPINFTKFKPPMVTQLSKDMEDGIVRLDKEEKIHEYENYTYSITPGGRWTYGAPDGQHDDCVSAKMLCHWGITQEGAPDVKPIMVQDLPDGGIQAEITEFDPDEVENEDYSYLFDEEEADDSGVPAIERAAPDPPELIARREDAWRGLSA